MSLTRFVSIWLEMKHLGWEFSALESKHFLEGVYISYISRVCKSRIELIGVSFFRVFSNESKFKIAASFCINTVIAECTHDE